MPEPRSHSSCFPRNRRRTIVVLLLMAMLLGGAGATAVLAQTVTLEPSKDNTLYESLSDVSNGAGQRLFAGRTRTGQLRRAVLAFDVAAALPAGAEIVSVELQLTLSRERSSPHDVALHRLTADWGEGMEDATSAEGQGVASATGSASWPRAFVPATLWATPGGDFTAVASATASVGGLGPVLWTSTPELVADVQAWLDDPAMNFGWIVIGDEITDRSAKRFDSRENATLSARPQLTIEFSAAIFDDGFESGDFNEWSATVPPQP